MRQIILSVFAILSTATSSVAADDINWWQVFDFSKTTPESVIFLFGPPATIKTEEMYSDWVKNQASLNWLDRYLGPVR